MKKNHSFSEVKEISINNEKVYYKEVDVLIEQEDINSEKISIITNNPVENGTTEVIEIFDQIIKLSSKEQLQLWALWNENCKFKKIN